MKVFNKEHVDWLKQEVVKLLEGSIVVSHNGINLYTPDGMHNYNALWTRDFQYMVENAYELIPEQDIKKCVQYLIDGIRKDGAPPDRVQGDGMAVHVAGHLSHPFGEPNIDNAQFLVNLVYYYVIRSGDMAFLKQNIEKLDFTMDYIPLSPAGLVYNNEDKPHSTYGFIDAILITGELLFCSILYWQACCQMVELAEKLGNNNMVLKYKTRKELIEKNIYNLYNEKDGMFYSSTGIDSKLDIWGSAFLVYTGLPVKQAVKDSITKFLIDNYDKYVYHGQIRHLLKGEYWDRFIMEVGKETYQNGAYWGTATGWIMYAIYQQNPELAVKTFNDFIDYSRANGLYECVNENYKQLNHYVATGSNVYGAVKFIREVVL